MRAHQLEQQPWRGCAAHLDQAVADRLRGRGQPVLPELRCLLAHPVELIFRSIEQARCASAGHSRQHDQVAQPIEQVHGEPPWIMACFDDAIDGQEDRGAVARRQCFGHLVKERVVGIAQQGNRAVIAQSRLISTRDELVEN